jgi:hypothetical protein
MNFKTVHKNIFVFPLQECLCERPKMLLYTYLSYLIFFGLWKKRIPFTFNDESTGLCICLRLDLYMSHVKSIGVGIGHTCKVARLTRDYNNMRLSG